MKYFLVMAVAISVLTSYASGTEKTLKTRNEHNSNHKTSHTRQYHDNDLGHHNKVSRQLILEIVLPTIVVVALIVIIAIIICIIYRTHFSYGSIMCCHTPKRHPAVSYQQGLDDDVDIEEGRSPSPPDYHNARSLSPPVYSDAINDVLLLKGVDRTSVSLPAYNSPSHPDDHPSEVSDRDLQSQSQVLDHFRQDSPLVDSDRLKDSSAEHSSLLVH